MKLTVLHDDLTEALGRVASAVPTRSTMPVLANVLLKAEGQTLSLTATDLALTMHVSIPATVKTEGAITLEARRLAAIVRDLVGEEIEMDATGAGSVRLTCGTSRFRLNGITAENFPQVPMTASGASVTLEQKVLRSMLEKTAYATSTDTSREVLTGLFLELGDDRLTAVATDGRRLALAEHEVDTPHENFGVVIPARAVHQITAIANGEGMVTVTAGAKMISVDVGGTILISTLVDGKYPNYRQVIPSKCEEKSVISREGLLQALRRVSHVRGQRTHSAKLSFQKDHLTVTVEDPEVGEAQEELDIQYGGRPMVIPFNPDYLIEPLKNLVSDEIVFEFNDEASPAVIKCSEPFLYVVMPVRLSCSAAVISWFDSPRMR